MNLATAGPAEAPAIEPWTKIHARGVSGRHNRWRWALVVITQLLFYGLPWLRWDGHSAVLFDLEARRFWLFGAVLLPQDLIALTALLVVSALALFFATALAGRVWCGFACPQTVYTELFTWIEARCEGDRRARQRLDATPWGATKLLRRGGKHAAWALLSGWTGLTLVGYFTPLPELLAALGQAHLGPWEGFWALFYGGATYANAGFLREKICQHMCPYARFQGSLMDAHTLTVAYDAQRGEPRGRPARSDIGRGGRGGCVDCTLCVQVCPVGIDIRAGLQSACINCGLCIDACDPVMDRIGAPRGLIRFASEVELAAGRTASPTGPVQAPPPLARRLLAQATRPRVAIYGLLLLISGGALIAALATHPTLRLDAMRDRSVLARETADGGAENVYRLLAMNASARVREVQLSVAGGPAGFALDGRDRLRLEPGQSQPVTVTLRLDAAERARLAGAILPVQLRLSASDGDASSAETVEATSTFIVPR